MLPEECTGFLLPERTFGRNPHTTAASTRADKSRAFNDSSSADHNHLYQISLRVHGSEQMRTILALFLVLEYFLASYLVSKAPMLLYTYIAYNAVGVTADFLSSLPLVRQSWITQH